jgi:hypothetical protein
VKPRRKKKSWIIKAAKRELEKDNQLIAELVVAEKLGKTLVELREQMTADELLLWCMFYEIRSDQEKKQLEDAKRRRR